MKYFEKVAFQWTPNRLKAVGYGMSMAVPAAYGSIAGAMIGVDPNTDVSPGKGAAIGAGIGAALGATQIPRMKKIFDASFTKSYSSIRKMPNLSEDLKILHVNKRRVKTKTEVKKQYRNLARRYHPDFNPKGEEKFKEVADAWGNVQKTNWYEKLAAFFEKTEKDLTNKELQKELRKGYFTGGLGQIASGGIMGAYAQSFLGKVGKRPWKGLALGATAGLATTPVSNILDKKDILKEVDRRKKHPGYR